MKKTMTSKKGAKEDTEKNEKIDQARSKKEVLNLRRVFLYSFLPFKAPESPPRGWGSAAGVVARSCVNIEISEKRCARAQAAAHFSKMGRETSG